MSPVVRVGQRPLSARQVVTHYLGREVKAMKFHGRAAREDFDARSVHRLRVSTRRLRSEIQAMTGVLPKRPWRPLSGELKWMATSLGGLRDVDVLSELFGSRVVGEGELHEAIETRLARRRATSRRAVSDLLDSPRYSRAVKSLDGLIDHPGLGATGRARASDVFLPSLWSASCAFFDSVADPYERRSDGEMHRVRIAAKKCRYHFEVAELFLGDPAQMVAEALEAIQEILGRAHDRSVAVSFLDTLGLNSDIDVALRRELRAEIADLRPQWAPHYEVARRAMIGIFDQRVTSAAS